MLSPHPPASVCLSWLPCTVLACTCHYPGSAALFILWLAAAWPVSHLPPWALPCPHWPMLVSAQCLLAISSQTPQLALDERESPVSHYAPAPLPAHCTLVFSQLPILSSPCPGNWPLSIIFLANFESLRSFFQIKTIPSSSDFFLAYLEIGLTYPLGTT